jgi:anti-anti-sigma regulatory factor
MKNSLEYLDNNKRILNLSDDLTIQNAGEFKTMLGEALDGDDVLMINLDSVTSIDLSCLQLLCALHKSAMQTGKSVTLEYSPSSVITKALRQAGYIRQTGCAGNKECFWSEASNG